MQQSQRTAFNHALDYAILTANELRTPVVVVFGITPTYPGATLRHYKFMVDGLLDVAIALCDLSIAFVVRIGNPPDVALDLGRQASVIVCDRGYLRHQREWRYRLGRDSPCRVIEIESDLVVPVEIASAKREYAARTIRPKIRTQLPGFLKPLASHRPVASSFDLGLRGENDIASILSRLHVPSVPGPVSGFFRGGQMEAARRLSHFVSDRLSSYESLRSEPSVDASSGLSPYLHFGHISDLQIAIGVGDSGGSGEAFLEELLVRRSLAHNYVWYSRDYDKFSSLPQWARNTLALHRDDQRSPTYTMSRLIAADTRDEYWNAAMREMLVSGYMHNYMRMYWGKKVLEWSDEPEEAFERLLEMNNRYFLDGRDPNSYANVGWIFGLHDRPWQRRPIFGTVRTMTKGGLDRKFHMEGYLSRVKSIEKRAAEAGPS